MSGPRIDNSGGAARVKRFCGAIITHLTHSDWYRENIYRDAKDGWYLDADGTSFADRLETCGDPVPLILSLPAPQGHGDPDPGTKRPCRMTHDLGHEYATLGTATRCHTPPRGTVPA